MRKSALVLGLLLAASCCLNTSLAAGAHEGSAFSDRLCVPMPEMLAIRNAFKRSPEILREMAYMDDTLSVVRVGERLQVSSRTPAMSRLTAETVMPPASSCATSPAAETINGTNSINAAYVASFDEVMSYRRNHLWPLFAINADPSRVDVVASRYGPYVLISLGDNYLHRDAAGNALLGCWSEYYRVDVHDISVLPFDGCVEGHKRGILPALSQLPPPAATNPMK